MNFKKAQLFLSCALLMYASIAAHAEAQTSTTPANVSTSSAEATIATNTPVSIVPPPPPVIPKSPKPLPLEIQNRVINLAANMSNRSDALIIRFELIIVRIESRLKKMEAAGYDTTDARFYVEEAQKSLELARTTMGSIDAQVHAFTTAENYWTGWFAVRDTLAEVAAQLQKTKQLLSEAVTDMRLSTEEGVPTPSNQSATTSTSTNNN